MATAERTVAVGDIGGTHARFALASLTRGAPPVVGAIRKYRTSDYPGLPDAWAAFVAESGDVPPDAAAIAVAAPVEGDVLRFTNSAWTLDLRTIQAALGVGELLLLNDFGAVAHAVSAMSANAFEHLSGPKQELPDYGVITVLGPGTGLGVALIVRRGGRSEIVECEGGHIGYAPRTAIERQIEQAITGRYGRCSVERVASGPGLMEIYAALGGKAMDAGALWESALRGNERLAAEALDLLVGALGMAAGDLSLAHGSTSVVLSGSLANRLRARLAGPVFREAFIAKGRYRARMEKLPVLLLAEPEPGLTGAAVAFQRANGS